MTPKTAKDMDMVNKNLETLFKKVVFPYVVPVEDLNHMHPSLFCSRKIPNVQFTGSLKSFIENCKILTNEVENLSLMEGYTIPFHEISQLKTIPNSPKLSQRKRFLCKTKFTRCLTRELF